MQPIKLLGSQLGWAQLTTGCWKESRLGLRPALLPLRPALLPLRAFILPLRLALLPPTGCLSPSPPSPPPRTGGRRWPGSNGSAVQGGDLPIFSTMITRVITSRTTAVQIDLNDHTGIVAKKRDPGILDPELFSGQIRKVEARLGKLAKIRKVETD